MTAQTTLTVLPFSLFAVLLAAALIIATFVIRHRRRAALLAPSAREPPAIA